MLEKIGSVQLGTFLEKNYAFDCHCKSTENILLLVVDNIVNPIDSEDAVCATFSDFIGRHLTL